MFFTGAWRSRRDLSDGVFRFSDRLVQSSRMKFQRRACARVPGLLIGSIWRHLRHSLGLLQLLRHGFASNSAWFWRSQRELFLHMSISRCECVLACRKWSRSQKMGSDPIHVRLFLLGASERATRPGNPVSLICHPGHPPCLGTSPPDFLRPPLPLGRPPTLPTLLWRHWGPLPNLFYQVLNTTRWVVTVVRPRLCRRCRIRVDSGCVVSAACGGRAGVRFALIAVGMLMSPPPPPPALRLGSHGWVCTCLFHFRARLCVRPLTLVLSASSAGA